MEDSAKTYFASLVCNHPDGNHKGSVCALRNFIYIYLGSAWSLRSLRPLREKKGLVLLLHGLRVRSINRTVPIA